MFPELVAPATGDLASPLKAQNRREASGVGLRSISGVRKGRVIPICCERLASRKYISQSMSLQTGVFPRPDFAEETPQQSISPIPMHIQSRGH